MRLNTSEFSKNDDKLILVVSVLLNTELQGGARQGRERRRDPESFLDITELEKTSSAIRESSGDNLHVCLGLSWPSGTCTPFVLLFTSSVPASLF